MKKTLLPLLVCAALSAGTTHAATPPSTLIVAQTLDDLVSLDPAESNELSSIQTLPSLYQRLVQADRDDPARLQPMLAASWQENAADKSLRITLRPDAVFASGNAVTSDDVIFSLRRAVKLNKSPAFILNILGWQSDNIGGLVSRVDDNTLLLRWTSDISPAVALNLLSTPIASIVDSRAVLTHVSDNDFGNGWLRTHAAGSGPFTLRVYQPHEAIVLDANPHAGESRPRLKGIIIKNVPDAASRRLLVQQGDADIARDLGPDQTVSLEKDATLKVLSIPSAEQNYLVFNTQNPANPLLNNPAF